MKGYIYKLTNIKTKDFYIGSTIKDPHHRFVEHQLSYYTKFNQTSSIVLFEQTSIHDVTVKTLITVFVNDIKNTITTMKTGGDTWVFKNTGIIQNYEDYHSKKQLLFTIFNEEKSDENKSDEKNNPNYMSLLNYFDTRIARLSVECNEWKRYYDTGYFYKDYYRNVNWLCWCDRRRYARYYDTFNTQTVGSLHRQVKTFKTKLKGLSTNVNKIKQITDNYIETYNSSNENEYGNIIKAYENQILYQVKQIFRSQDYRMDILEQID